MMIASIALALVLVPYTSSVSLLPYLIQEADVSAFMSQRYEKEHFFVSAGPTNRDRYGDMFVSGYLDSILSEGLQSKSIVNGGNLKIVKRVKGGDNQYWTQAFNKEDIDLATIHGAFNQGYSIVLNKVNFLWSPVARLCEGLSDDMGVRVNANMYFTPPNAQAFEIHMDWMENFIIHLEGSKKWSLYHSPIQLPRKDQIVKPVIDDEVQYREAHLKGNPTLRKGDMLYIPSGQLHEAVGNGGDPSLHLTLGVEVDSGYMWEGFLHAMVSTLWRGDACSWIRKGNGAISAVTTVDNDGETSLGSPLVSNDGNRNIHAALLHHCIREAANISKDLRATYTMNSLYKTDPAIITKAVEDLCKYDGRAFHKVNDDLPADLLPLLRALYAESSTPYVSITASPSNFKGSDEEKESLFDVARDCLLRSLSSPALVAVARETVVTRGARELKEWKGRNKHS